MTTDDNQIHNIDPDPTSMTAGAIAEAIREGEMSSASAVSACLARIEETHEQLNAVIWPLADRARQRAAEADAARARGDHLGLLHGVPITIKDQFLLRGTPTSCGLAHRSDTPVDQQGGLVTRLEKAGAIILGKTSLPQLACSHECEHARYGHARNPWDTARTPGGSSGGEAAIIAAGGSPWGLGCDMGGSIRVPAHCCGIAGLKPTSGRMPNDDTPLALGFFGAFAGFEGFVPSTGPMARTVSDLKLMMDALLAEPFSTGEALPPVPWQTGPIAVPIDLRVGVYTKNHFLPASPGIRRCVSSAADALADLGLQVVEFDPPLLAEAMKLYQSLFSADGGKWIKAALDSERPIDDINALIKACGAPNAMRGPMASVLEAFAQGHLAELVRIPGKCDAHEYWTRCAERSRLRAGFIAAMDAQEIDVLVCPPYGIVAPPLGSNRNGLNSMAASHAAPFNLLGMPAGVVPAGRVAPGEESDRGASKERYVQDAISVEQGSAGLPVGVQVVGRHWREEQVLAIMQALETHFRGQPDFPSTPTEIRPGNL